MKTLVARIKRLSALQRYRHWLAIAALAAYFLLLMAVLSLKWTRASFSDQVVSRDAHFRAATWVCTHSVGYWKTHPETWPLEEIMLGEQIYSKEAAIGILNTPSKGDATYILAVQLIAAKLSIAAGADDSEIADTIEQADAWLIENPLGSNPKGEEREEGIALAEDLEAYNEGDIGPGKCEEGAIPSATPTPSASHTIIEAQKSAEAHWKKKEGHSVSGEICVVNLGGAATENLTIFDQVQYRVEGEEVYQDVEGAQMILQPDDPIPGCDDPAQPESCPRMCYEYRISFEPPEDALAFRNTASITITNHSDWLLGDANCPGPDLCPFGPQVSANFELSEKADKASEPIESVAPESIDPASSAPSASGTNAPAPMATAMPIPTETPTP